MSKPYPKTSLCVLLLALVVSACSSNDGTDGKARSAGPEASLEFSHTPIDRSSSFSVVAWSDQSIDAVTSLEFLPDGRALVGAKGGWAGPGTATVTVLDAEGATLATALELPVCADAERGLIGLAVDPAFAENGYIYTYYTRQEADCTVGKGAEIPPPGQRVHNRVSRFTMTGMLIDPASEFVMVDDLIGYQSSHNGGGLAFMGDGTLLIGAGEATQGEAARSVDSSAGKILRVDPRSGGQAPSDNPFPGGSTTAGATRGLVYASGLRNPFRIAVSSDDLVVAADVGTDVYEELNVIKPGDDYGFPAVEGPGREKGVTEPAFWYKHGDNCKSVIGGTFLTRGMFGRSQNTFVFGDFGCRAVWFAEFVDGGIASVDRVATLDFTPADFAVSPDGRLFAVPVGGTEPGASHIAEIVG